MYVIRNTMSCNVNSGDDAFPFTYPTAKYKKARELNVLSKLFSCLCERRTGRRWLTSN